MRKQKQRKLYKFNEAKAVNPNSGENVCDLVARTVNMGDGPREMSAETFDVFSDDINKMILLYPKKRKPKSPTCKEENVMKLASIGCKN